MTALSESLSLMIIRDVFSLPILTYLLFSWIGKPVLDNQLWYPASWNPWLAVMNYLNYTDGWLTQHGGHPGAMPTTGCVSGCMWQHVWPSCPDMIAHAWSHGNPVSKTCASMDLATGFQKKRECLWSHGKNQLRTLGGCLNWWVPECFNNYRWYQIPST